VLDAGVVLEPVQAQVLAVAGVLEAAVGHLGDQGDVGVDPDAAEVQGAGHAHGAAVVAGPDAGGEAVLDAVGPGQGLLLVVEALDGDDRAEDLLLDHLVVLLQAVDHGGLVEEAAPVERRPPVATSAWPGARSRKPSTLASWLALLRGP
jgi:hypothetical protein